MTKPPRDHLYPIMFWSSPNDGIALLANLAFILLTGKKSPLDDPRRCVKDAPQERRELAARLLAAGKEYEAYMGYANCRICNKPLGTKDLYGHGFIWPEQCEHYVLEHGVWVPALDRLIERSEN